LEHLSDTLHDLRDHFSEHDDGCYAKDRGTNYGLSKLPDDKKTLEIISDPESDEEQDESKQDLGRETRGETAFDSMDDSVL
jgi:hypothetical protein